MERSNLSDSTLAPARQAEAEHIHDAPREPDTEAAITQMLQAPVDPDAPDPEAEPKFGYITRPPRMHPNAYGLVIDENGAGLRMPPGAIVLVEPVPPSGRDLCVVYTDGTRPSVWQIGESFEPGMLGISKGSDLHPLIELFDPCDGHRGYIDAKKVTKLHRVAGIQASVEVMNAYGPGPDDLPLLSEVPDGCLEHVVEDARSYPVLRPGDVAIIDTHRTALAHGALVLVQWNTGDHSLAQTNRRSAADGNSPWMLDPINRPQGPGMLEKRQARGRLLYSSEGPFQAKTLQSKVIGTVIGILSRKGGGGAPGESAAAELPKLMPATAATEARRLEPSAPDPVFAAIAETRRLMAAEDKARGARKRQAAMQARLKHCDGVLLQTVPTTAQGCVALARFAKEYWDARGRTLEQAEGLIYDLIARSPAGDQAADLPGSDFTPWDMDGACPIPTRDQWIEAADTALPWLRMAFVFMGQSKANLGRLVVNLDDEEFAGLIENLQREQRQFRHVADMAGFALRRMALALEAQLDANDATPAAA